MGRLTTHILDTSHGTPACGVEIRLYSIGAERKSVAYAKTNADGRTEKPLLDGEAMRAGQYELEFDIGDLFSRQRTRHSTSRRSWKPSLFAFRSKPMSTTTSHYLPRPGLIPPTGAADTDE